MLKGLKMFIAGFIVSTLLLTSTIGVLAASLDVPVSALLMGSIKMKLNGKDFNPKDTDGTYVQPIMYNGRTYLPVRSLADGLKVPVDWDKNTKTVWIGGRTDDISVDASMYGDYYGTIFTKDTDKLTTADSTYKWGICNGEILEMAYFGCFLKPNGNYKYFTASIFLDEGVKQDLVMEFRKDTYDGEVIKSITLKPGETTSVDVEIAGVNKFYILSSIKIGHDKVSKLVIGEPIFTNKNQTTN